MDREVRGWVEGDWEVRGWVVVRAEVERVEGAKEEGGKAEADLGVGDLGVGDLAATAEGGNILRICAPQVCMCTTLVTVDQARTCVCYRGHVLSYRHKHKHNQMPNM